MRRGRAVALGAAAMAAGVVGGVLAGRSSVRRHRGRPDPEASEAFGVLPPEDLGPIRAFDGTDLTVRAAGPRDAPVLLFSHGITLDMTTWHYQWRSFSDRYRCVLFDHRCHGRSGRPPFGDLSVQALGRDLREVMERVAGDQPVVLIGHSMGGMAIASLAEQHPEEFGGRVAGAVFVDTGVSDLVREFAGTLGAGLERRLRPLTERLLFDEARAERVQRTMHRLGGDVSFLIARATNFGPGASAAQIDHVTRISAGASVEVWTTMLRGLLDVDLRDALGAITCPSLVVVGDRDMLTPKTSARVMREILPDARAYVLTTAGHLAMMEQHQLFDDLLEGFLTEVFPREQAVG